MATCYYDHFANNTWLIVNSLCVSITWL